MKIVWTMVVSGTQTVLNEASLPVLGKLLFKSNLSMSTITWLEK